MPIYLREIIQMVKENPNDADLGGKVRSYVNNSQKGDEKPKPKSTIKSK